MRKLSVLIVVIFLFMSAAGQDESFGEGLYINYKGDTIRGLIAASASGSKFKYKSGPDGIATMDIDMDSVRQIKIGKDQYTIWYGKRKVIWLDLIEHEVKNVDSFRTERIPLKLKYSGPKYSLYAYKDETERFFIGYDGKVEELLMNYTVLSEKEYRDNSLLFARPRYTIYSIFRDQVIAIMGGQVSNRQKNLINNTDYNLQHLKRLIVRMNR